MSLKHRFFVCLIFLGTIPLAVAQNAGTTLSFTQSVSAASESPTVNLAEGQFNLAQQQLEAASGLVSGSLSTDYTQYVPVAADETATGDFGAVTLTGSLNVIPYGDVADQVTQAEWTVENAEAALGAAQSQTVLDVATQYLETLRYSQEEQALTSSCQRCPDCTRGDANASSSRCREQRRGVGRTDYAESGAKRPC